MAKFRNRYRIEPNRLQYWDYSAPGQYFLTVCIENRECILGDVDNGKMILSSAGEIVKSEIEQIPAYHPRIILDEWIIMPNHIHLIVELAEYDIPGDDTYDNDGDGGDGGIGGIVVEKIHEFSLQQYRIYRRKMLIPIIMGKFKMITSKQINILNDTPGKKNWQRDYYEHIIRDNKSYLHIKKYIRNNPKNWNVDTLNI